MFERRLIIFIIFLIGAIGILLARLAWLQVVDCDRYTKLSQEALDLPAEWLETVRGNIYDCRGRALAQDQPSFELCLHYKLTRLYDERFWKVEQLGWDRLIAERSAEKCAELESRRAHSDNLLMELAEMCDVPLEDIFLSVERINNNIHILRCDRALRRIYETEKLNLESRPVKATDIQRELIERMPEEAERLEFVFDVQNDVVQARLPQFALAMDEDTALMVAERFVGSSLTSVRSTRPISIRIGKKRIYPYADAACHLIGQLWRAPLRAPGRADDNTPPTPQQLAAYLPGDRQGEWGVEYIFEKRLRGRRGWFHHDRQGQLLGPRIEPVAGTDVTLSIDIALQQQIRKIFEGDNDQNRWYHGAAVIIDVPTAHVRAMVSVPTFDLNSYYQRENFELLNELNERPDPDKHKINRALCANYMPGSTIKPTMLLGALEQGIVSASTGFDCYTTEQPWRKPFCPFNHGPIAAHDAIMKSCQYYFVRIAQRMKAENVINWLSQAGVGEPILIWPQEHSRQRAKLPTRETGGILRRDPKRLPSKVELRFTGVGLHPVVGSILQIANSMATIARGGLLVLPTLVSEPQVRGPQQQICHSRQNVRLVQQAMQDVVQDPRGTAYKAFEPLGWSSDELSIHGKTGSTDCSLFGGFARARDGRCLAWAVLVEQHADQEPGGGEIAAPLARRILEVCGRPEFNYLPAPQQTRLGD